MVFEQYIDILRYYKKFSSHYLLELVEELLEERDDLIQAYHQLQPMVQEQSICCRENERWNIANANAQRREKHIRIYQTQEKSALLRLPREIRDTIWEDVVSASIVHVSKDIESTSFSHHLCVAPGELKSSACPAGKGDHADCPTTGPSDFRLYRLICRQNNHELPVAKDDFFPRHALHFDDMI